MELKIGKAAGRDFYVDAQELVTGRTCIIAQSGAGKSWSIAVLCEKMCRNNIGFCLIDTEGEYYSLKEKFDNIWWIGAEGGDSRTGNITMDFDIEKVNIRHILQRAVAESRPVIYDVSEIDMIPRVSKMTHELYEVATDQRKPYLLIVEEADKFIPQSKDSIKKIEEISRRGRKRGLGLMVATQRPAIVTKNVLSQCNNQIIGKLSIDNDLKAVGLFFSSKQEVEELTTLNPGDFYVMGNLVREKTKMRFGRRETQHRGLTPLLEYREISTEEDPLPEEEEDFDSASDSQDYDDYGDSDEYGDYSEEDAEEPEFDSFPDSDAEILEGSRDEAPIEFSDSGSGDAGIDFIDGDSEEITFDDGFSGSSSGRSGKKRGDSGSDSDLSPAAGSAGLAAGSASAVSSDSAGSDSVEVLPDVVGKSPAKRKTTKPAKASAKMDKVAAVSDDAGKKPAKRVPVGRGKPLVAERVNKEAILPVLEREEALSHATGRLKKRKFGFGTEERLLSADLVYIPLVKVTVKYIGGILRKGTKRTCYLIDGRNAKAVEIDAGLKYRSFIEEYIGLDEACVEILDTMPIRGETAAEIEAGTKHPKKIVDKVISTLTDKKLITESDTLGESDKPVYVPLVETHLPAMKPHEVRIDLKMGEIDGGYVEKRLVEESDVRTVFKIIEATSEIVGFETIYYPVYKVTAACGHDERILYIDGVSGKEVVF